MSLGRLPYRFVSKPWKYNGPAAWYFVSLPKEISAEIRSHFKDLEEGWGRLLVQAKISDYEWKTAIWFDTKQDTYLLPLKSEVRKKVKMDIEVEQEIVVYI